MIRSILTDIEGTTSSIAFVKDVLFPYAREHLAEFVRSHAHDPEVRKLLADVSTGAGKNLNDDATVNQLMRWMDEDRKITPLKTLQGLIWERGYSEGHYTGHVYRDAAEKLGEWHKQGIKIFIYSSGSVAAQKLIFGHSDFGDLTLLFSGYFDTHIGSKRVANSYRRIASEIGLPTGEILFLSDIAGELDAAKSAGMLTQQLVREADSTVPAPAHPQAKNFYEIDLKM